MSDSLPEAPNSPSRVGNFVLAYDTDLAQHVETDGLLRFIDTNFAVNQFCDIDSSFFPRAFTDPDLIEASHDKATTRNVTNKNSKEVAMSRPFDGRVSSTNYQPDVIVSNCSQRSGPDGSPALAPSASRTRVAAPSSILSETGELFAPVRTLTYSDVDQNSQIDDSCMNSSRFVSTPNRGAGSQRVIYGSGMAGDDSDSNSDSNPVSSEFRELEGQAENDADLMGSGNFQPSAFGLNQEFMDQFTGRTGNPMMSYEGDIFSPVCNGDRHRLEDQRSEGRTPPLHSPVPNSPYAKYCIKNSPKRYDNHEMQPEMQFQMSPTRNESRRFDPSQAALEELQATGNNFQPLMTNRQEYMRSDRFYPNHYTFEPIDKQPTNVSQRIVPRNLEEYDQSGAVKSAPGSSAVKIQQLNQMRSSVGVGGEVRSVQRIQPESQFDTQFAVVSPSTFEQRYLQKMQVSVTVPAVTYDAAGPDLTNKSAEGYDKRFDPPGLPPDSIDGRDDSEDEEQLDDEISSPDNQVDIPQERHDRTNQNQGGQGGGECDEDSLEYAGNAEEQFSKVEVSKGVKIDFGMTEQACESDQGYESRQTHTGQEDLNVGHADLNRAAQASQPLPVSTNITVGFERLSQSTSKQPNENRQFVSAKPASESQSQSFHGTHTSNSTSTTTNIASASGVSKTAAPASNVSSTSGAPSSRLLQETVSQKLKSNQKYQSSAPAPSKSLPGQNKEFKKPLDVAKSNPSAGNVTSNGARKTLLNESDRSAAKIKTVDKTKSKSISSESLNQKTKTNVPKPWNYNNKNDNPATGLQSRGHSYQNQASRSEGQVQSMQGYNVKGQGHREGGRAGGSGASPHGLDSHGGERRVVTQVESTSPVPIETHDNNVTAQLPGDGDMSLDVRGMEEVRHQIRSMLRVSHSTHSPQDRSHYEQSEILAGYGVDLAGFQRPPDMAWNNFRGGPAEGDCLVDNFPSFSSQFMSDSGNVSRSDTSLSAENQRLRDMLEKERYRRKHCEQYIQQLNVKLLETQQQVAVAVSTDKRKDIMIEQLDKQLAKVVDGWRRKDQEKDELMESLRREKDEIQASMDQQQEMIGRFEHDMSDAVEALRKEKEQSTHNIDELRHQLHAKDGEVRHAEELCAAEKDKAELMTQECDSLREARDNLDKKLDTMQRRLHREQDEWYQREQELLQRIEEVSEKNIKILQHEKSKSDEQAKLADEIMDQYQEACTRVKKMEMDLDASLREKESMKIEIGIMEAKFENAHRVLEADLHATMEKQISTQIADVMKRNEKSEAELQERHRQGIIELNQRHGREMEKQLAMFREDLQKKEVEHRRQLQELEERLTEFRNENSELKLAKQKLESTRLEILTKLQYAMQSQWNEALSMLSGTPHRRSNCDGTTDDRAPASLQSVSFSLPSPLKGASNQPSASTNQPSALTNQPPVSTNQPPSQNTYRQTQVTQVSNQQTALTNQMSLSATLTNEINLPVTFANQMSQPVISSSHMSLPVTLTNQARLPVTSANEISPPRVASANQNPASAMSPGEMDSMAFMGNEQVADVSVEMTALSHFKNFQEYMNSLTKTPEWIATINSRAERAEDVQHPPHGVPSPTDVASILSSHLYNVQSQHMTPHPYFQTIQPHPSIHQHSSNATIQSQGDIVETSSSQALNAVGAANGPNGITTNISPPRYANQQGSHQLELSVSGLSLAEDEKNVSVGDLSAVSSEAGSSVLWSGAPGMSHAVQIRPPQQGPDPYLTDEDHSLLLHINNHATSGYYHGRQSFSPPTKQDKPPRDQSMEDFSQETSRLNSDYAELSEKLEKHESQQNDLQHYIHLLLNKSSGSAAEHGEHNDSLISHDELDLDDTAQAAQLQAELDRIQVLRQKQEAAARSSGERTDKTTEGSMSEQGPPQTGSAKILSADQMAEVTRLLNQVQGHGGDPEVNPKVTELLDLLRQAQGTGSGRQGLTRAPGQRQGHTVGPGADKHRGQAGVRKGAATPAGHKGPEKVKHQGEVTKPDKPSVKGTVSSSNKKVERKVAGVPAKGDKSAKPSFWK